ncbi:hypothetical protein [Pseudoalteromonas sp. S16_S37]|uniref:hypothetical protein n=1 Tax=Pseudoalteromonas sp. S16_S37 TaxID=2720228 RepID=UPI00167FEF60|nr:hypothetical protein [Pseudoalteromonas sp. S16_S37]MBD1583109.1 hypothetical protein [Pseudoalteromonas sp. S16_S37]
MEIQCDAIRVKAKLSEQPENEPQGKNAQQQPCTRDSAIEQLEQSLKRYVDKQFQQFTKQRRP